MITHTENRYEGAFVWRRKKAKFERTLKRSCYIALLIAVLSSTAYFKYTYDELPDWMLRPVAYAFSLRNDPKLVEKSLDEEIVDSDLAGSVSGKGDNMSKGPRASKLGEEDSRRRYTVIYNHIVRIGSVGPERADWMARYILASSQKWRVDPLLVTALFTQESGFRMSAVSKTGAYGIAQIQPETARQLGIDYTDPAQNMEGGIRYLAEQLGTFQQAKSSPVSLAVAAYNAGPGAVKKYGGVPPYNETVTHVKKVGVIFERLVNEYNNN